MGIYSIAEAKDKLSSLVKQAEEGEDVAITRHGKVVAYLRPAAEPAPRRPSPDFIEQLAERAKSRPRLGENAVDSIRRMRDGGWDSSRLVIIGPKRILAIASQNGAGMPIYSIAKAKDNLSKMVDEAVAGEEVAITRHGKVVAYLRSAVERPMRQPPHELVAEIMARARKRPRLEEPGIDVIRRMRDDYP